MTFLDKEISQQGAVIGEAAEVARRQIGQDGFLEAIGSPSRVVLTGCGDSLFAAELVEAMAVERGVPSVRAVEAMELSRYEFRTLDHGSLIVALSYGGETIRVREAAVAARSRGAYVIAVTREPDGPLARASNATMTYPLLEERSNTRTMSFQAAVVVLREILGAVPGTGLGPQPEPWEALADAVSVSEAVARRVVPGFIERCRPVQVDELLFLGAGPNLLAARYGAAKCYEAATVRARTVELEEFCHCEIFSVRQGTPVVLIAPEGQSSDRALEVLDALGRLGCVTLAVSNVPALLDRASVGVNLPPGMHERHAPVVAAPIFQVLALFLALQRGDDPDLVCNKQVNSPLIRRCSAWDAAAYRLQI